MAMMQLHSKPQRLPGLPSQLIYVALRDLREVLANPLYVVDMGEWHNPKGVTYSDQTRQNKPKAKCAVCFAGSVIAHHPDAKVTATLDPYSFDLMTRKRLNALNDIRNYHVASFLTQMGYNGEIIKLVDRVLRMPVKNYFDPSNPEPFFAGMKYIADQLADLGL